MAKQRPDDPALETLSFEAALAQLEDLTRRLEEDTDLTLDESVALFEQGQKLAAFCQGLLDNAELRVRQLTGEE